MVDGDRPAPWAVVLAGGEGSRLRDLTRQIEGDERPKQFCRVLGPVTLVEETMARVSLLIPPERQLVVVMRGHHRFYAPLLAGVPPSRLVVQPQSRGTAPAILYAMLRLISQRRFDPVVLVPSDHYVSDDAAFMAHVERACAAVGDRPELVVMLGITPDRPETAYGWVEPGKPFGGLANGVYRVETFWEKPSAPLAEALLDSGCFWNSFVIVARPSTLLTHIERALPELVEGFTALEPHLGTMREAAMASKLYPRLPWRDFSADVLTTAVANLGLLPVEGIAWSDLGEPERVFATLDRVGARPTWLMPQLSAL